MLVSNLYYWYTLSAEINVDLVGVSADIALGTLTPEIVEIDEGVGWTSRKKKKRIPFVSPDVSIDLIGIGIRTDLGNPTSELSLGIRSAALRFTIGRLSQEIRVGLKGVEAQTYVSQLSPEFRNFFKTYSVEEMNELILQLEEMEVL